MQKFRSTFNQIGNRGQIIVTTMVASVLVAISLQAMLKTMALFHRNSQAIEEKDSRAALNQFILAVFSDPDNCSCQLDSEINLARKTVLKINSTLYPSPVPDIPLDILRSGCVFNTPNNILAEKNQILPGSSRIYVHSVRITQIKLNGLPGSLQYSAILRIRFKKSTGLLKAVEIPLLFNVDPDSPATARRIASCSPLNSSTPAHYVHFETSNYIKKAGETVIACDVTEDGGKNVKSCGLDSSGKKLCYYDSIKSSWRINDAGADSFCDGGIYVTLGNPPGF